MSIKTPFGKIRGDLMSEIYSAGGLDTGRGREMILTEILSQYLAAEAMQNSLISETGLSLLRTMSRTLVHFAATISFEDRKANPSALVETIDDLVEAFDELVEMAIDEFAAMEASGGVTVTRMSGNMAEQ